MAACSFYVSYPSQFSNDQMMDSQNYMDDSDIRDELIFHPSQSSAGTSRNSISSEKRSSLLQDYFKSSNALSRSIIMEKCSVEQQHSKQWTGLSDSKRDEIVDKYFVPSDVRDQYDAGLIGSRRSGSRLSLDNHMYSSQEDFVERYNGGMEHIDGHQPMSQPSVLSSDYKTQKSMSMTGRYQQRSHSVAQLLDNTTATLPPAAAAGTTTSSKSKLKSFSIRKSKNSKKQQQKATEQKVIPSLFTRDVYELDNEVDLPDDSLLTDHIAVVEDDSFARLKPLRYSFGRKMRSKVTLSGSDQLQSSGSEMNVNNGYMVPGGNHDNDFLDSSLPDLTQATQFYNTSGSTPDLLDRDEPINRADSISPINISDDAMSISSSRPNTRTPDSSQPMRTSPNRIKPFKESKHPLSRSVRAGSSYMTVTSSFADNRRQMFKMKKNNTNSQASDNTPINSPINSPPPQMNAGTPPIVVTQHTLLKKTKSEALPMVKTESVNESVITDTTTSSSDLPSPMCSPPSSPAGLCPNNNLGRNKRESGYISSTYPEEMSDDETDGSSKNTSNAKRKPKRKGRTMQVQRTDSFTNNQ